MAFATDRRRTEKPAQPAIDDASAFWRNTRVGARTVMLAALAVPSLVSNSCAVEEIIVATVEDRPGFDGGPGSPPPHRCATNLDCFPEEFCAKLKCDDAMGACSRRQPACGSELAPTCGCDGVTYFNDCWRKNQGVSASTPDECDTSPMVCGGSNPYMQCPPPPNSPPMSPRLHCAQLLLVPPPMGICPPDIFGRCWFLPPTCGPTASGDVNKWTTSCGPSEPCVDTCTAIERNGPHWPAQCP